MKKIIGICLFLCVASVAFTFWYLWYIKREPPVIPLQETEQATEQVTETEFIVAATESMSLIESYDYQIIVKDGFLVIYDLGKQKILFETGISYENLELSIQERIDQGLYFLNEQELYDFLESNSS